MQNFIYKVTSRKFWTMLIGFITSILIFYNVPDNNIVQITSIIGGFGTLVIYILSETSVDLKRLDNKDIDS